MRSTEVDERALEPIAHVSVREMAELCSISVKKAYRLLDSGVIDSRYLGARRLVRVDSLNAYLEGLPSARY